MANPVWVLSVNLETRSAAFVSGMSDAAKAARGAFTDIRSGASAAGREVGTSMFAARHSLMAIGEMFGGTLPRAITAFIADIGPMGEILTAAFPFAAIALGAFLLLEHLTKLREEGEKLTLDQTRFMTAAQNAFGQLDEKLLQAQIRSDELRNDHLGALQKQLELIDKQSMNELVHSFAQVAKEADVVFADLKTGWYQLGIGSAGAKHALDQFQTQYESLLAQGKDKEAGDLLGGTLKSAQRVLELQKEAKANSGTLTSAPGEGADLGAGMRAQIELKKSGVGFTEKELAAQEALVGALDAQVKIEQRIADLKKLDSANATKESGNEAAARQSEAAKEAAANMQRMGEQAIAADRATADAQLTIKRASIAERLASDLDFAARERDVQLAGNAAEISALDKSGKDYANQLKALKDKALEITQEYATKTAEVTAKASIEQAALDLRNLETSEREKIDATREGSAARLAAVNAAIREEETRGLQDTQFYRDLLQQRIETTRSMFEEEAKVREQAGKEEAETTTRAANQILAMTKAQQALENSARLANDERRMQQERDIADKEFAYKLVALRQEMTAVDQNDKERLAKLRTFLDQEQALIQQHEDAIKQIKMQSETEQNTRTASAIAQMRDMFAQGLTSVLMGHQSFASMMDSIGDKVASGMITTALKSMMAMDMTKEKEAAAAARKFFNAGAQFPFPTNIVMAPVLGAMAFASVMAFEGGSDGVPGVGRGDVVPAMLTPGEGVVPGGTMDSLNQFVRNGGFKQGGGTTVHVHYRVNNPQALDSAGMDRVLEQHSDKLQKHFQRTLRRMNK